MVTTLRPTNDPETVSGRFDVAVVGGGLAGLTAAATAAQGGRSVVLFEQASAPGGRARTRTEDGYSFNIGPHALFRKSLALDVLRGVGVEVNAGAVELDGSRMVSQGRLYSLPVGLGSLVASPLLDWRGKIELGMFLGSVGRMDPRPFDEMTLSEWLVRSLRSPSARKLAEMTDRTATYTNDPDLLSAGAALRQLKVALSGALYVHGGWQTIVDDLRSRAEALGVVIVDGARVAEVELMKVELAEYGSASSAVQAVRLGDGRRYEVGSAILAVPPRQASALVDDGRQAALAGWAERAVPVRAAVLDVGLRRLPNPETWYAMGFDRPLYLSVHSKWARLAPEGGALVHVLRYLGSSERGGEEDERELEGLLDLMQPGWRNEVVTRRFMPDLTVVGAMASVNWEQRDGPRGPAVPDTDGLFVAGDWVTPEGMLADRALVSGARAGQEAAGTAAGTAAGAMNRAPTLSASVGVRFIAPDSTEVGAA